MCRVVSVPVTFAVPPHSVRIGFPCASPDHYPGPNLAALRFKDPMPCHRRVRFEGQDTTPSYVLHTHILYHIPNTACDVLYTRFSCLMRSVGPMFYLSRANHILSTIHQILYTTALVGRDSYPGVPQCLCKLFWPRKRLHPVSITRFPPRRFSPGAGLLRNPFVHRPWRKIFQGLGPKRQEPSNGDRVYNIIRIYNKYA